MIGPLLGLLGALSFPVVCLGFLFLLAHLEDTLPRDVQRALRKPAPPPIVAIPVREPAPAPVVLVPEQRPAVAPLVEVQTQPLAG